VNNDSVLVSYTSKLVSLKWQGDGIYLGDTSLPSFDVRVDDLHEKFIIDDYDGVYSILSFI
jgi:hypothetical protein